LPEYPMELRLHRQQVITGPDETGHDGSGRVRLGHAANASRIRVKGSLTPL
jgi:hypothetical protein